MITLLPLLRLMQLTSPALPVGAYAYSQGLESAVELGLVNNAATAQQWIAGVLQTSLAHGDAPIFLRLFRAWQENDFVKVEQWNEQLVASRETAELRAEDTHLGAALMRLLSTQEITLAAQYLDRDDIAFATAFALAAQQWQIEALPALQGLLWSWLENQVAAATKLVPLGQTAAQQILARLQPDLVRVAEHALWIEDHDIYTCSIGLAILSAQHETQYSRLFRS